MSYEKIITADGSVTYMSPQVGAPYRSVYGAKTESQHVFIEGTRLIQRDSPWRVLELGFGTGLNFHTTAQAALKAEVELEYTALEPFPLPAEHWLVDEPWRTSRLGEKHRVGSICLTIENRRWQEFDLLSSFFNAGFHDPFAPRQAPDCWTVKCFQWWAERLTDDGILATFGASTAGREAMAEAGFFIGRPPGANGKREMTVASKTESAIATVKPWRR